ncbi:MAG TPA: hypothetical protein VGU64_15880 [Terriglobales bacterium]|nr:hypothetical protein [Terriglobales bacterium]
MNNRLCFATFDPLHDVPSVCSVCASNPPVFRYEFCADEENTHAEYMKGFCCASCAAKLLRVLEHVESREWAEEQAALEAEGLDTIEFRKRRLAAFAGGRNN